MEYTVVLSSIAAVLLGLGVIAFFVSKRKANQENLIQKTQNIKEEQARLIQKAGKQSKAVFQLTAPRSK